MVENWMKETPKKRRISLGLLAVIVLLLVGGSSCILLMGAISPNNGIATADISTNDAINNTTHNAVSWNESEWQMGHPDTSEDIPSWCKSNIYNAYGYMRFEPGIDQPAGMWVNCDNGVTVTQYRKNETAFYWKNQTTMNVSVAYAGGGASVGVGAGGGPGVPGEQSQAWVAPEPTVIINYTLAGYYGFSGNA